jgi:hypothetical protein
MNGVTSAAAPARAQPTPRQRTDLEQLRGTGFRFDPVNGIDQNIWLDRAQSRSASPELRAQYRELVDIAGGRTDRPSLLQAMEVAQAYFAATAPNATASDRQAYVTRLTSNLEFQFGRLNPTEIMAAPLQSAGRLILDATGASNTEWGQSLNRALGMQVAFNRGIAEGIWEGGRDMVATIATAVGRTLQYGADNSVLGTAGDAIRGLTGRLPDVVNQVLPSNARGAESTQRLVNGVTRAANYFATHTPAEVAADIGNMISAQWDSLRASHAAAAAKGPEAEARWWGQVVGRIGFEIGSTFIPVAGVAGKISGAVRTTDRAADLARGVDTAADAARAADGIGAVVSRYVRYVGDGPLFRGDRRAPSEIFRGGFRPRGGTDDLADYVANHTDSIFVSTSKSADVVRGPYYTGGPGGFVYDIDPSRLRGIDVNRSLGRHDLEFEAEIAFPGGVPRDAIMGARQVMPDGRLGDLIENPFYRGPD